jgi:phosphoenolpyruvate synthase/pyruvate phosphate dikinase
MTAETRNVRWFATLRLEDVPLVGGKNAALGELYGALGEAKVRVPNGFALTADAYRDVLTAADAWPPLHALLDGLDVTDVSLLAQCAEAARRIVYDATGSDRLRHAVAESYRALEREYGDNVAVAVRSSPTAEDLPRAGFAGQHDSYLNVTGPDDVFEACRLCFASLFTDRAIGYRVNSGFNHFKVSLSVGVMKMVRSDMASSGVIVTLDPVSGLRDVVFITGAYGLGENVVQGKVDPDEFYVHKPTFLAGHRAVLRRSLGQKQFARRTAEDHGSNSTRDQVMTEAARSRFCIADAEVLTLADHAIRIEQHYSAQTGHPVPMVIEWAKDAVDGGLYIVQARPETVALQPSGEAPGLPRTQIMVNLGDPDLAFRTAMMPNAGVGLAQMEFIISRHIGVHPMALLHPGKLTTEERVRIAALSRNVGSPREFFVRTLAEGVGTIAAAFWPKPVIARLSNFTTDEYAQLLGGAAFEPKEANPMLGFRGASRYVHPAYADGFALECEALRWVREDMGLTNLRIMVPFCRRVAEAELVIEAMARHGLQRGVDGLEIYLMCEIPNNVIRVDAFAVWFDGFSICANDLAQLTLGVDRDSELVASAFDQSDPGVLEMLRLAVAGAKRNHRRVGICGDAAANHPGFARFLAEAGVDWISVDPSDLLRTIAAVREAEAKLAVPAAA